MSHQRAMYAARFLKPPSWTKRLLLREKPRDLTGPFENPVRRWVRLREKARQFSELPPPRKIPFAKPARKKFLQAVEGVPKVSPDALQRRIDFLLSQLAVEQQLAAPLRPGLSPYYVEYTCWERQLRDLRRCYRAQYLQKLAEVTEIERAQERELYERERAERRRRKMAHLQRIGEDMKRRAILKDRHRIEAKVNEALEMARRSKLKRRSIFWYRRMETLSKLIASADNFEEVLAAAPPEAFETDTWRRPGQPMGYSGTGAPSSSGVLLSRNVSVPFLMRQLGGAKGFPLQRSRRIPHVFNISREILESSYDILPEDAPRVEPLPAEGPDERQRAAQLYGVFSAEEKRALLEEKIHMLEEKKKLLEGSKGVDQITQRLYDELMAVRNTYDEGEKQAAGKAYAKASRGADPPGLPPKKGSSSLGEQEEDTPLVAGTKGGGGDASGSGASGSTT